MKKIGIKNYHNNICYLKKKGKLVFWWGHLGNIYFSKPDFMKYKNQFLMWKIIYFSCTLSWLHILYRYCLLFFSFYTDHSPLPPFPMKPTNTLPMSSPTVTHTSLRSVISPSLPFSSLFFSLSFHFDITKRKEDGGNGGELGPKERRRGCLPLMAATSNFCSHWRRRQRKHQRRERGELYPEGSTTINLNPEVSLPSPWSASLSPLLDVSPYVGAFAIAAVNDCESCWLSPSMATNRAFFPLTLVLHHCHHFLLSWWCRKGRK